MYMEAKSLNITMVSVGHRDTLKQHHNQLLILTGNHGSWNVSNLSPVMDEEYTPGSINFPKE